MKSADKFAVHTSSPLLAASLLRMCARICSLLFVASMCPAQDLQLPTDEGDFKFGITVVSSAWLKGDIYLLNPGISSLPKFKKLKSIGSIYTPILNLPARNFREGFPGITDRFEWFAIDYKGRFWISRPGKYRFLLISDDGAKLYIDEKTIISNDGIHPATTATGEASLAEGVHDIRVSYFQGPRYEIALILAIAEPGEKKFRVFNLERFQPPAEKFEDGSLGRMSGANSKKKSR